MAKQTMGQIICSLRKEKGMTQKELAEKMGVTDKAVSKWERDLSCPDITTLPKLAQLLDTSLETLMDVQPEEKSPASSPAQILDTVLKAVPLAMGTAVCVLSLLGQLEAGEGLSLLAVGMVCLAIRQFTK